MIIRDTTARIYTGQNNEFRVKVRGSRPITSSDLELVETIIFRNPGNIVKAVTDIGMYIGLDAEITEDAK